MNNYFSEMLTLVTFEIYSSDRGDIYSVSRELIDKYEYKDNLVVLDKPHMVLPFPINCLIHTQKNIEQAIVDVKDVASEFHFSVKRCVAVEFTVSQGLSAPSK